MSDLKAEEEQPSNLSRRGFLKQASQFGGEAATAALVLGTASTVAQAALEPNQQSQKKSLLQKIVDSYNGVPQPKPEPPKPAPPPPQPPILLVEKPKIPEDQNFQLLQRIVKLDIDSRLRKEAEAEYVQRMNVKSDLSVKDIDMGLWAIDNSFSRSHLLGLRFELRKEGREPQLHQLSAEQTKWAEDNHIHPETLAMCLDAYDRAKRIIQAFLDKDRAKFRPDLVYKQKVGQLPADVLSKLTAPEIMLSMGGMAKLICTETGGVKVNGTQLGFTTIGEVPAFLQINSEAFPGGQQSIEQLCNLLNNITHLGYTPENIPGSPRGDVTRNISGGAVFSQILPGNLIEMHQMTQDPSLNLSSQDRNLNPADPTDAIIFNWLFISRAVEVTPNEFRFGYLAPILRREGQDPFFVDPGHRIGKAATGKWNPDTEQRDSIIDADTDYHNRFPVKS